MILYYMDESGTGLRNLQSPFFVLAVVSVPADSWHLVDNNITALKRRLISWAKPEDFEIKGRDIRQRQKFFRKFTGPEVIQAMMDVADLIVDLPIDIIAVQVDKRDLPTNIAREEDLYRLAFWRLLDGIEANLQTVAQPGMLMVDARSDFHSSIQDRRLLDIYQDWAGRRKERTHLTDLPWFGFSDFYAGLQLADFAAYIISCESNETDGHASALHEIFARLNTKVTRFQIP